MSKQLAKSTATGKVVARGGQAAKREATKPKKAIFNAKDVASRLKVLREAAIEELHGKLVEEGRVTAQAAGQSFDETSVEVTDEEIAKTRWWSSALKFDWSSTRKGGNGTQWVSCEYRDAAGVAGPLVVRVNGERHCGQIMPLTDEGVAELASRVKNPNVTLMKRDKKPSVQIQKWSAQVKTLEDGFTIITDEEGMPILPSDDKLSAYYQVAALVNEAFVSETRERTQRGVEFLAAVRSEKLAANAAKANAKAQSVLDSFAKAQGVRSAGDMILSSELVAELRKNFSNPKDQELLLRGAIQTSNTKIASLIQETIGLQSKKNQGLPLPNPMTRIALNFDATTGMAQMAFYDKDKPYEAEVLNAAGQKIKKQQYDIGKVEDDPVNAENIHKFILPRSIIDGIVNMDSVCFSNMGISMPVKADVLVVEKAKGRETILDDVYGDDESGTVSYSAEEGGDGGDGEAGDDAEAAEPMSAPPQPSPAPLPSAPTSAPSKTAGATLKSSPKTTPGKTITTTGKKPAAPPEENYDALLEGLGSQ